MLERPCAPRSLDVQRPAVALHVLAAVALDQALDGLEQVGPHRLRAEIAAPDAAGDRVHQEQRHRRQDQQAGEVVDFLRPDLDEEEIEAPVREVDQHRLVRRVGAAVPAHERQQVIDAEGDDQHHPFDLAERAVHALRIDLAARRVERDLVLGRLRRRAVDFGRLAPGARAPTRSRRNARAMQSAAAVIVVVARVHAVTSRRRRRSGRRRPAP